MTSPCYPRIVIVNHDNPKSSTAHREGCDLIENEIGVFDDWEGATLESLKHSSVLHLCERCKPEGFPYSK